MSILDDNSTTNIPGGLAPTGEMKRNWVVISKWAMFFAILGFVYIGLSLISLGSMAAVMRTFGMLMGDNPIREIMYTILPYATVMSLVVVAALFFISFFHLRFATNIQKATNMTDQGAFEKAWLNLRNHYRLFGIMVCVMLAFYVIMLIFIGTMVASAPSLE